MRDFFRFFYLSFAILSLCMLSVSTDIVSVCKLGFQMLFDLAGFGIVSYWIEKEKK